MLIRKKGLQVEKNIYLNRLNSLRGLFALEIVIGHVVRSEDTILFLFGKFMIISVAFFFFVSGFGLVSSYEMKSGYLKGFLAKKLVYLFEIAILALGVNTIVDAACKNALGYYPPAANVFLWFVKNTNWYLFELGFFYILFYVSFKFIKKYSVFFIFMSTIVLATIVFLMGWTEMWYASAMGFPAGVIFGKYYDKIIWFLKAIWGKLFTLVLTLLGLASQLLRTESLAGMVYLRNVMCIACLLLLTYIISRYSLENKVSMILMAYSTEIYLFQFVWLKLTESYGICWQLRLPAVLAGTMFTAFIMHPLFVKLRR